MKDEYESKFEDPNWDPTDYINKQNQIYWDNIEKEQYIITEQYLIEKERNKKT